MVAAGSKSRSFDHASLICESFHKVLSPLISRQKRDLADLDRDCRPGTEKPLDPAPDSDNLPTTARVAVRGGSALHPQEENARIAQLVERFVYTELVGGSSPSPCTIPKK